MSTTFDIVQKLWNLCNILRDDGVQYSDYVTELTYLLFLKMSEETDTEAVIPKDYRWKSLTSLEGVELLQHYREMLVKLGEAKNPSVQAIFANAQTSLRQPRHLHTLVSNINALDWYSARHEGLGDLYEGLLQKNAEESKSGAGQYFTPRPLIDSMVAVMKPQAGEHVNDPAAGTIGFIVAADRYIKVQTDDLFNLSTDLQEFQKNQAFTAMELVPGTHRLALMNALLHDIHSPIVLGDTLSGDGKLLKDADLVLTNPPFGTKKGGGGSTRDDFTFSTSNKQLAFLQHIYRSLRKPTKTKPGGRAAVVLPDNVLFESGVGKDIRRDLMDKCNLHTILRLPTGIFYAQGVKTNVLFFTRGAQDKGNTKEVWVYDMRSNMPNFGKRTPFTREHFTDFEKAFGKNPLGEAAALKKRKDTGEAGRFRKFAREWIAQRDDSLDISWLKDDNAESSADLPEPAVLAASAMEEMEAIMEDLRGILAELGEDVEEVLA
ncbi:MAG: N-6 DNA methylase [Luteolibacter sp.]|jgi:type I restriction enzyme M protein|nr:N-6 DNA methylase [Luteolibacter sp.]